MNRDLTTETNASLTRLCGCIDGCDPAKALVTGSVRHQIATHPIDSHPLGNV
jgi:hypothetical protein